MERTGNVYEIPYSDSGYKWRQRKKLVQDLEKAGFWHSPKRNRYFAAYFMGDIVKENGSGERIGEIREAEVISINQSLDKFLETYQF